jgi:hypothetical protein
MGGGVDEDRWAVAGDGMKPELEDLVVLIKMLGNGNAQGEVTLPYWAANAIAAILLSLPGRAERPQRGPGASEYRAWMDACDGKSINAQAREIAEATGQLLSTVRRRLYKIREEPAVEGEAALEPKLKATAKTKRRACVK